MEQMKITFQYMCDEIVRFRKIIESRKYTIDQKDDAVRTLVWTWVHGEHDMTVEEEASMATMLRSQMIEWTRRKSYEMLRPGAWGDCIDEPAGCDIDTAPG